MTLSDDGTVFSPIGAHLSSHPTLTKQFIEWKLVLRRYLRFIMVLFSTCRWLHSILELVFYMCVLVIRESCVSLVASLNKAQREYVCHIIFVFPQAAPSPSLVSFQQCTSLESVSMQEFIPSSLWDIMMHEPPCLTTLSFSCPTMEEGAKQSLSYPKSFGSISSQKNHILWSKPLFRAESSMALYQISLVQYLHTTQWKVRSPGMTVDSALVELVQYNQPIGLYPSNIYI